MKLRFLSFLPQWTAWVCLCLFLAGCENSSADLPTTQALTSVANNQAESPACCATPAGEELDSKKELIAEVVPGGVEIPNTALVNQEGEDVRFHADLVEGNVVAINFVFTTCKGICPPMGANYAQLQKLLAHKNANDIRLISVSVDPVVDTPERLKAWREKFGGELDWTLLTGVKQDVDQLLKELQVYTADKNEHSPFILIGDDTTGRWQRVHGLTSADKLAELLVDLKSARTLDAKTAGSTPPVPPNVNASLADESAITAARKYFTDTKLVNQHGEELAFYSDLLDGKVVVVNSFFAECKGACPVMLGTFQKIQDAFPDRMGKDLHLISVSVDAKSDTPKRLHEYAESLGAKPGWHFITGEKKNVDWVLYRLGHYVEKREDHSNVFIVGNLRTGLWKKVRGLSSAEQIIEVVRGVLDDQPGSEPAGAEFEADVSETE